MDDAELIQRFADTRSNDAFAELVRRHLPLVYSAALRRLGGDAHRAEDVAQCVFAELARQAGRLSRHTSFEGWLYTTTRNIALREIRTERRRAAREREVLMNADRNEPTPGIDATKLRPVIDGALDRLGARDRELVLMRFFRDHAFVEIGKRLGISDDAARFRLNRALERLREELRKVGVTSTPAALAMVLSTEGGAATTDAMVRTITSGALSKAATAPTATGLVHIFHLMSSTTAGDSNLGGFWRGLCKSDRQAAAKGSHASRSPHVSSHPHAPAQFRASPLVCRGGAAARILAAGLPAPVAAGGRRGRSCPGILHPGAARAGAW